MLKERLIYTKGRLISDITGANDGPNTDGLLGVKKVFDSSSHSFLLVVLTKFNFGKIFISWIKVILKKPESYAINSEKKPPHFQINRGARQSDPISANLFILVMEPLLTLTKSNSLFQVLICLSMTF